MVAKNDRDRYRPSSGAALRCDEHSALLVPGAFDADSAGRQIDVLPTERLDLPSAQAGEERGRPKRAVGLRDRLDQCRCLLGRDANRSRRPRTAGSSTPAVGLTASSPRASARRQIARTGISAFLTLEASRPDASRRSARDLKIEAREVAELSTSELGQKGGGAESSSRSRLACQ